MISLRTSSRIRLLADNVIHRNFSSESHKQFKKILIANRGEISCRVQRTAKRLGIRTVAVYSDADANAQHVLQADEAYHIGSSAATDSYLKGDRILQVAKQVGAEAIHPGYGFLSENAAFAEACAAQGIEFIGPPSSSITAMGSKSASKEIMINAGVPVTPGYHGSDQNIERLTQEADKIGYPIMIKAVKGGGGKGMRIVDSKQDFSDALEACKRESIASFGDDRVLIEKYLRKPRHVELQVFADKFGNCIHLFERDCSVQRRHQKVLEEAPAPGMTPALRKKMGDAAVAAAKAVGYVGAGTVEFMLDEDDSFYFMEMNTRLQVEHPVTEMITKQDLVELQLKVAAGEKLPITQNDLAIHGHAIEARVYAENPYKGFLPGTGEITHLRLPPQSDNVRTDTGIVQGDKVSVFYDPMIAKLIVWGENRQIALQRLVDSLKKYEIAGLTTNIEFLARTASHPEFAKGGVNTSFLGVYGEELTTPFDKTPDDIVNIATLSLLLGGHHARELKGQKSLDPFSPWTSLSTLRDFRLNSDLSRHITLLEDTKEYNRTIDAHRDGSYTIKNGDSEVKATGSLQDNGRYIMKIGENIYKGSVVVLKDSIQVFCDDGSLMYSHNFKFSKKSYENAAFSDGKPSIVTPMPGKVIKVFAHSGDLIKKGQPVIIMEAMKMEHVIKAPCDGRVEDVFFKVGDFVEDGKVLVEMQLHTAKK